MLERIHIEPSQNSLMTEFENGMTAFGGMSNMSDISKAGEVSKRNIFIIT